MAEFNLQNTANVEGLYGLIPTELTSDAVITQLISELTIIKTADKALWADNSYLTYTVTITNNESQNFTTASFTDLLDTTKIVLVDDSVKVNGDTETYTYDAGLLSVTLPDINAGDTVIITFQVQKV